MVPLSTKEWMNDGSSNGQESSPFQLTADAFGRLVLTDSAGQAHMGVQIIRAFPISSPQAGIAITSADGKELAWIDDLAQLPAALRRTVEEHLGRREFVPVIRRIIRVRTLADKSEWEVETDRGRTTFQVQGDNDVRALEPNRALLVDTHGIRYLIADLAALDAASSRYLERFL